MTQPAAPETDPTGQTVTLPPAPPRPAPQPQTLTMEEVNQRIEAAREQEKAKLYERLEEERKAREAIEARIAAFDTDLATRQQAEEDARAAAAAAAEEKRLAELSFGEKLAETEQRFGAQLTDLQSQLQQRDVILEKERQFNELMQYRNEALNNSDREDGPGRGLGPQILPELRDLVRGNTREEIEASVSALAERSASILGNVVAQTQAVRQGARGVGVTAPPVGPMDNNSGHQTVTAEDIRDMDMATYAANRGRLLGAASQQQRDRGMFG